MVANVARITHEAISDSGSTSVISAA